jgi:RNA polymerase sigma-70 factor, ECF subfamily
VQAGASSQTGDVTVLLRRIEAGDRGALGPLMDLIYPELRRIAQTLFRNEGRERILEPTALVNEAYLRLVGHQQLTWRNRAHFLGAAARTMRRILVERARARLADKRGAELLALDEVLGPTNQHSVELGALEDALVELAQVSPRQASVVEMRYFGGLTVGEAAEALGITPRTVDRDWAVARAWLRRYLKQ